MVTVGAALGAPRLQRPSGAFIIIIILLIIIIIIIGCI